MKTTIFVGLAVAITLALFFSPFASSSPDGLEKVAEIKGFLHTGEGKEIFSAPIPDYTMPGIKHEGIATSFAGLVGTLLTFGIAYGFGYILKKDK